MKSTCVASLSKTRDSPARIAVPLPPFRSRRITSAPAASAASAVPSVDPSSTTSTVATMAEAPRTTAAMVGASLKTGTSAHTFMPDPPA